MAKLSMCALLAVAIIAAVLACASSTFAEGALTGSAAIQLLASGSVLSTTKVHQGLVHTVRKE